MRYVKFALFAFAASLLFANHATNAQTTTAPTSAVVLTWQAPTQNIDGSTPPDVSGYNVYMAATQAALVALPNSVNGGIPYAGGAGSPGGTAVISATTLTFTTPPLAAGTYWFAVTAWYCSGSPSVCVESSQSAAVSITLTFTPTQANPPAGLTLKQATK